jgi:hypothetical protein
VWAKHYPDEPFFLEEEQEGDTVEAPDSASSPPVGGFDLARSTMRQNTFLWQVSTPSFQDPRFLQEGERKYRSFLALKADHPLVPTFQIDLMWRTHMLSSITQYNEDCVAARGESSITMIPLMIAHPELTLTLHLLIHPSFGRIRTRRTTMSLGPCIEASLLRISIM